MQGFPKVHVGANVNVSDLVYAGDIAPLSNNHWEMQGLLEAGNQPVTATSTRISAMKTKVMSALIPGEQHQTVLLEVTSSCVSIQWS